MKITKNSIEITPAELFEVENNLRTSVSKQILNNTKKLLHPDTLTKNKTFAITTSELSLKARIKSAWWCLTGKTFDLEPLGKISMIKYKEHYFGIRSNK